MTTYLLGVLTVLALLYNIFGSYVAVQQSRHGRPSQLRHNGPPLTWNWHMRGWVFWPTIAALPLLWPVIVTVMRLNSSWNIRRWNQMTRDERCRAYQTWKTEYETKQQRREHREDRHQRPATATSTTEDTGTSTQERS